MLLDDVGPHCSPEPARVRDSSQPYTENIKVPTYLSIKRIAKSKGPWYYWNEQKILLHPSINATIVIKVHLVPHDPIHPVNSQAGRLLSDRIRSKMLLKAKTSSPFHMHKHFPWDPEREHLSSWAWILTGCNSSLLNSVTERLTWNLSHGMTHNSALTAMLKKAQITSSSDISEISCKMAFSIYINLLSVTYIQHYKPC